MCEPSTRHNKTHAMTAPYHNHNHHHCLDSKTLAMTPPYHHHCLQDVRPPSHEAPHGLSVGAVGRRVEDVPDESAL